ncbi:sulfite oxidase [Rhizodiscina lignyota]|uniref:Sulfite oxidase n=1 Tax=Rhizodiscina lignyota TaxID=1504668 RepID=A0A9P4I6K2_9PEZI|nr:sulfite oxidase [Rhizodiscina lignyota]
MPSKVVETEHSVEEPLNCEPDIAELIKNFITPKGNFYDRNHGPIPHLDGETHTVQVDGAVETPIIITVKELQEKFKSHTVIAALQCAGNRRHTMRTEIKEVQGIDWSDGAVFNAVWRGPRLCDILNHAKIKLPPDLDWKTNPDAAHVQLACYATETQEDNWYGSSIPLARAMRPEADVILALEMNGEPLTPEHGYPIRTVVPGVAGARSVKWLDRITVSTSQSSNFYQVHDYKVLPPEAVDRESAQKFWHSTPPIEDMPVNSIIAVPSSGEKVELDADSKVEVRGYALPKGEDGPVVRVEVSGDEGETWVDAKLSWGGMDKMEGEGGERLKWAWCLWEAHVVVQPGRGRRIWSKATDSRGNVQPQEGQWTLRGVCYNAYGEAKDLEVF